MRVVIRIALSQAGRREDVIAGGEGRAYRDIIVPRDHQRYAEVVRAADIDGDEALLDMRESLHGILTHQYDFIPTLDDVLEDYSGLLRAVAVREAAAARRRQEMNLREDDFDYGLVDGAMTSVPIYERSPQGKNWMAAITNNPGAPGGLGRNFLNRPRSARSQIQEGYYEVNPHRLPVGSCVEFGADFFGPHGKRVRVRWYGYVVRYTENAIILHHTQTAVAAISQASAHLASIAPPPQPTQNAGRRRKRVGETAIPPWEGEERPPWEL